MRYGVLRKYWASEVINPVAEKVATSHFYLLSVRPDFVEFGSGRFLWFLTATGVRGDDSVNHQWMWGLMRMWGVGIN